MKARSGTDGSLLSSLPWTLAALSLALAPHTPYLPLWIVVAFFACAAVRWQIEKNRWRLPPAFLRVLLALSGFIGVFASFESISGVGPGSALLAVMAALKLLETRQRRDQFVLLFISIFLVMASLLREQEIWSLPFLISAVLLTMTAWLRMSAVSGLSVRQSFRTGGRLLLCAAPLAIAMWLFFPRIATPFWSVPIDTSSASSGLNDEMSPGDVSSLSMSDAVAFRVEFDSEAPPPSKRYWRGLVLHRFDGRTWSGRAPSIHPRALDTIQVYGNPVSYRVTMEPTQQQWIFALDIPYRSSLHRSGMGSAQQLVRETPVDRRLAYDAVSYLEYRADAALPRALKFWYLDFPNASNKRTQSMARQMRSDADSDAAYINDVLAMFHQQNFFYTLEPPALGSNPVDRFLFDTRQGFCEHYASAFALMMRAAGIPARVVLGYQGGEMNPMGQYMIVRQSDAHAWTEVWLSERGWVRVDPTGAVAPERIESGMSGARFAEVGARWGLTAPSRWLYDLQLTWDALNAKWNGWILAYGPENQSLLMQWFGMDDPNWRKMVLVMLAVVAVLVAGISYLLLRHHRPPARDRSAQLYRRFVRKAGIPPLRGETPEAYAGRLSALRAVAAPEAHNIARLYLAARYGSPNPRALAILEKAVNLFGTAGRPSAPEFRKNESPASVLRRD